MENILFMLYSSMIGLFGLSQSPLKLQFEHTLLHAKYLAAKITRNRATSALKVNQANLYPTFTCQYSALVSNANHMGVVGLLHRQKKLFVYGLLLVKILFCLLHCRSTY